MNEYQELVSCVGPANALKICTAIVNAITKAKDEGFLTGIDTTIQSLDKSARKRAPDAPVAFYVAVAFRDRLQEPKCVLRSVNFTEGLPLCGSSIYILARKMYLDSQ